VGTVIGDLLPLALGVAISPVPIIAVILMLLSPRAGAASVGFALGWLVGIVTITAVTVLVASGVDIGGDGGEPSTAGSWVSLVLGLLLVALGVKQWRDRPEPGESAPLPKWMAAIDNVTPVRAVGLGFLLSAVNPKNLLMCVSAGVAVADRFSAGSPLGLLRRADAALYQAKRAGRNQVVVDDPGSHSLNALAST
jgi:threonine/homoserine/homoserine lactone efflux protein